MFQLVFLVHFNSNIIFLPQLVSKLFQKNKLNLTPKVEGLKNGKRSGEDGRK